MTGHEIRQKFLDYFAERAHRVVKSSPLLPANDPSLLFTNAGMNQFKDVFLGLERRDYKRAASSQKCVRAGGKHNDLDEVGRTARHHTFFEMLGNFSFGDYFKKEAIYFAWDLLVNEFKLDPARMWFTVFEGDSEVPADEEAVRYWEQVGARPERILRFGRKDNFWQMADTGPCGPNSEINYYLGENPEDPESNRAEYVNGPGERTVEIWNLVFMQFNRVKVSESEYRLDPLPSPSVDTGAGLERLAAVLQGVKSNYDTDLIKPIIDFIAGLCGKDYDYNSPEGVSMRVVADHARATAFSLADGIAPGNVSRNYVLRKIMRRAIFHGVRGLGMKPPFFHKVTSFVGEFMGGAYPELISSRHLIEQTVRGEEQRFSRILNVGEPRLAELFDRYAPAMPPMLELARNYDTYGVPRDLIRVELGQHGTDIDEEEFNEQFDAALRELQQQTGATMAEAVSARRAKEIYAKVAGRLPRTEFRGYEETETANARVLAIIVDDQERERLAAGETGEIILDRSPFYAESGGQIGDTGMFEGDNSIASVEDTYAVVTGYYIHKAKVEHGELRVGDGVYARVDAERRRRIRANHTGTHLLHAALREVLGPHVKQAGSLVAPDRLRFDFTHYAPLAAEEVAEIERLVNTEVLLNRPVETEIKPLDEALKSGAMALFGEKYASDVRVVSVPGFSTELCGGTHVRATGDIGPFKIISDSSIAAGVRRLEALTADAAIARFQNDEQVIDQLGDKFKTRPQDIPAQVDKLIEQVRRYEREIDQLKLKIAQGESAQAADSAREVGGIRVLARRVSDLDANGMRQLADTLSQKLKSGVVVLGQATNGKASLVARVTDDLTKRLNAGQIVREVAAIVGGKGGGRADMATGGGPEPEKLDQALDASYEMVGRMLDAN
ncbi:MAG TPA: alanine--tRNA ligase [Blastocatellia bacterium]|jgi:alanyl-tRNA synthetase|nr:alanine--tRNA ligase [Blastocatellia bacterium]